MLPPACIFVVSHHSWCINNIMLLKILFIILSIYLLLSSLFIYYLLILWSLVGPDGRKWCQAPHEAKGRPGFWSTWDIHRLEGNPPEFSFVFFKLRQSPCFSWTVIPPSKIRIFNDPSCFSRCVSPPLRRDIRSPHNIRLEYLFLFQFFFNLLTFSMKPCLRPSRVTTGDCHQ